MFIFLSFFLIFCDEAMLNLGAGLDLLGESNSSTSTFEIRSFELGIDAKIDKNIELKSWLSYHEEEFMLENAFVLIKLPRNFKAKLGREFLPFGALNQVHLHEYPQVDKPYVLKELGSEHAMIGDGLSINYLINLDKTNFNFTFGVYEGFLEDFDKRFNTYPLLLSFTNEIFFKENKLNYGISYLKGIGTKFREEAELELVNYMASFNINYNYKLSSMQALNLAFEYLYTEYESKNNNKGFYTYLEWRFYNYNLGYRFDRTNTYSFENILAHSIYATYLLNDYSKVRLQYQNVDELSNEHRLLLQLSFYTGWHEKH